MAKPQYYELDDGCFVAPACLSCPLDVCRYDDPAAVTKYRNATRNAAIAEALNAGGVRSEVAARFGLSERTIYRLWRTFEDAQRVRGEAQHDPN